MQHWDEIEFFFCLFDTIGSYFVRKCCVLCEIYYFFNFKAVFHKIENLAVKTFYFRNNLLNLLLNF